MSKREELLEAAVQAHRDYVRVVAEAKAARTGAFRAAILGPVTAAELARHTGMSDTQVTRISKGQA